MNTSNQQNKCPRCGKERIVVKTYTEMIGNSKVTYIEKVCPDKECQKKVNHDIDTDTKKRASIQLQQEKREEERKAKMANRKKEK